MDEDVTVTSSDGADFALERCRSLVCDQTRTGQSKRDLSTRLYCSDGWEPVELPRTVRGCTDPLDGARSRGSTLGTTSFAPSVMRFSVAIVRSNR